MPDFGSDIKEEQVNGTPTIRISRLKIDKLVGSVVGSGVNFVENEIPTGTINSINGTFTLANAPVLGDNGISSLSVYSDGIRLASNQYTVTGTTLTITGAQSIPTATLIVDYRW